jgi:hypothetical protein
MDGLISLIVVVFIVIGVVVKRADRLKAVENESKKKQSYYSENTVTMTDSNVSEPVKAVQSIQSATTTVSRPVASPATANVSRPVTTLAAVPKSQPGVPYYQKKPSNFGIDKKISKETGNVLRDDRSGDWLAKQLADERKAYRQVSEMFELKAYHANQCEAEMLKRFHEENCDAERIDTAKGR